MVAWLALFVSATSFDALLARCEGAPASAAVFAKEQLPLVDASGETVFVYVAQGGEKMVSVVGDFRTKSVHNIYWDEQGQALQHAKAACPVFYTRLRFSPQSRLDYAFMVDGQRRADPQNPRTIFSGAGGGVVSELLLPGYKETSEVTPRADVAKGTLTLIDESWATPKVSVYLPAGYSSARRYPVVYTADGSAWLEHLRLSTILDNLIAAGTIAPAIVVLIDPTADRSGFYALDPGYGRYLQKVIAYVDAHYATRAEPRARTHMGSSAGGRASLYLGLERPDLVQNVALLSPALHGQPSFYASYFSGKKAPPVGLRVWLSAGSYEGDIVTDAKVIADWLHGRGIDAPLRMSEEGHSFGAWRGAVVAALTYFLSPAR